MLDALDEAMRDNGPNSLDSEEAAALAFGLLVRATSMLLGPHTTPDIVHRVAKENVDAILELREAMREDAGT
jgi:hypothetical protein